MNKGVRKYTLVEQSLTEHQIQSALIDWASWSLRTQPDLDLLYAIPNGGDRDARVGMKMKREGVRSGVPDLHLPVSRGVYHSLYIEVKTCVGTVKKNQKEWREKLMHNGNAYVVCRSIDEGRFVLGFYLSMTDNSVIPDSFLRLDRTPLDISG